MRLEGDAVCKELSSRGSVPATVIFTAVLSVACVHIKHLPSFSAWELICPAPAGKAWAGEKHLVQGGAGVPYALTFYTPLKEAPLPAGPPGKE